MATRGAAVSATRDEVRITYTVDDARLVYTIPTACDGWELTEPVMPESVRHNQAAKLLESVLEHWVVRTGIAALIVRNLAIRWTPHRPQIGADPDIAILAPPPPPTRNDDITSVRTWLDGRTPPLVAIEILSDADPHKDYMIAHEKYAASGTRELWVFDPKLCGPHALGGPHRLQVWRRDDADGFSRVYAGAGPTYSPVLGAHLVVVDDGWSLRIADDPEGIALWPTAEEAERAAKRAAEARIAELERELANHR